MSALTFLGLLKVGFNVQNVTDADDRDELDGDIEALGGFIPGSAGAVVGSGYALAGGGAPTSHGVVHTTNEVQYDFRPAGAVSAGTTSPPGAGGPLGAATTTFDRSGAPPRSLGVGGGAVGAVATTNPSSDRPVVPVRNPARPIFEHGGNNSSKGNDQTDPRLVELDDLVNSTNVAEVGGQHDMAYEKRRQKALELLEGI